MSIGHRQPEAMGSAATAPVPTRRPGDGRSIDIAAQPSEVLLPSVGRFPRTPVPAPARALALDARRLLRRSADPVARPAAWSEPGFERQVAEVRDHLAPLRTRRALAASFGRESFHSQASDAAPIRLAYAIRWRELGGPPGA